MAFEALRPHQGQILGLADQRRTLAQIADILAAQHGVTTTAGTLSRFIKAARPGFGVIAPSPPEARAIPASAPPAPPQAMQIDAVALTTELLAEMSTLRDDVRRVVEELGGKVGGLSADIVELEKAVARSQSSVRQVDSSDARTSPRSEPTPHHLEIEPRILRKVWRRALFFTALFWVGVIAIGAYLASL